MLQIWRLRLQVTVPYVDIEGPGQLAGDLGVPVIIAPLNTEPKHRSGLGDITVGAAYILLRENLFMPRIELAGTTKLPTAGDGLGTGRTDYGAQINLYRTLLPWLTTVGSVGYEWVGDINTVKLHSGLEGTAGANAKFLGLRRRRPVQLPAERLDRRAGLFHPQSLRHLAHAGRSRRHALRHGGTDARQPQPGIRGEIQFVSRESRLSRFARRGGKRLCQRAGDPLNAVFASLIFVVAAHVLPSKQERVSGSVF